MNLDQKPDVDPVDVAGLSDDLVYLIKKARTSYLAFYTLFALRPEAKKAVGRLQTFLCVRVQSVADSAIGKRQSTSCPPQHSKSDCLVRLAIAWLMGYRPGIQIGLACYDYKLVEELSMAARAVVAHPWYKLVFPESNGVEPQLCRIVNWGTCQGSRLRAVSIGKKLVGRRVDWFIGDDIYPGREEVEKPNLRAKVRRWFFADCMTRLSPSAIVWMVGTRWHPEDLCGYLLSDAYSKQLETFGVSQEIYEHVNLPALADPTEDQPDLLGRKSGESLCPEMGRDEKFLKAAKGIQPPYEWESQYMGRPKTAGSGQVDLTRLEYIDSISELPDEMRFARGWDLATKENTRNDFTVGAKCGWHEETQTFYILDIWRKKLRWPKLKPRITGLSKMEHRDPIIPIHRIGVEAVSGFDIGAMELMTELRGQVKVEIRNPGRQDKLTRAMPWFNRVEAGRVVLLRGQWNRDFLAELDVFPDGEHDDQVDAVTIAHEVLTKRLKISAS
jgi:predicted phage terminase large subunit-like protein